MYALEEMFLIVSWPKWVSTLGGVSKRALGWKKGWSLKPTEYLKDLGYRCESAGGIKTKELACKP